MRFIHHVITYIAPATPRVINWAGPLTCTLLQSWLSGLLYMYILAVVFSLGGALLMLSQVVVIYVYVCAHGCMDV